MIKFDNKRFDEAMDNYTGNLDWLKQATGYMTVSGSRSYGTDRPDSDTDIKGVAFPPRKFYTGFVDHFDQVQWEYDDKELAVFSVLKFVRLAADCNPNIIELLFPPDDCIIRAGPGIIRILEIRDEFLSTKAKHTFSGYAMSQLKRIKTHRKWLLNPPTTRPERGDFGLKPTPVIPKEQLNTAMASVRKKLDQWELNLDGMDNSAREHLLQTLSEKMTFDNDNFILASRTIGLDDNFIEVALQERKFKQAINNFNQYMTWKANRNEKRAALESKYGYDCKHAMHLVRLMRMGTEILEGKGVLVRRPDAEELKTIRDGAWSYDELIEWAKTTDKNLGELYKASALPKKPDMDKINKVTMGTVSLSWESFR